MLRDALKHTGKIGLGQFVMRGREYVGALKPCGSGLMIETLRFQDELHRATPYFSDLSDEKSDDELVSIAEQLIERKSAPFKATAFKDRYNDALRELIERKAKGRSTEVAVDEDTADSGKVVDLMAALKKSLGEKSDARSGRSRSKPSTAAGTKSGGSKKPTKTTRAASGKSTGRQRKTASKAA